MSDLANLMVGLLMAGSAAIGAARKVLERRRARRELLARPALAPGIDEGEVVRVTGIVRAGGSVLVSPISATKCVVYRSRVKSAGGLVRRAFAAQESFAMVPFVVERDNGERVEIEGAHALLDLPSVDLPKPRSSDERERRVKFLVLHGISASRGGIFDEVVVEPGARVTVAGLMMKDIHTTPPEGELGYRDESPVVLRLAGDVTHPLVIGISAPAMAPIGRADA